MALTLTQGIAALDRVDRESKARHGRVATLAEVEAAIATAERRLANAAAELEVRQYLASLAR